MRKALSIALMAGMVCLASVTKDAGATVTFSLLWISTTGTGVAGTNAINAAGGDKLVLEIRMTTDQTLARHGVSLNFDTQLDNELNLFVPTGGKEWFGTNYGTTTTVSNYGPATSGLGPPPAVESTTFGTAGRINTYESSVLSGPLFLPVGTYTIGTAKFVVNFAVPNGPNVFVGLFNTGDGVLNNLNELIPESSLVFGSASVNSAIPEPATAPLVALGLVGVVLASRRRRRS